MALDRCCFCCKLETGTSILGFLGFFAAILKIIAFSICLSENHIYGFDVFLGIYLGCSVIDFFTSIMLIIGVVKVCAVWWNELKRYI